MFDLSQLTEFNPALVYAFEPEGLPERDPTKLKNFEEDLAYQVDQYKDMFNGYLHAQTLIDWLRTNSIQALAEEQLIDWIKELHKYMGKTLLTLWRKPTGEFTDERILRWNEDGDMGADIMKFFSEPRLNSFKNKIALIEHCIARYQIDENKVIDFVDLVEKLAQDPLAEIDPTEAKSLIPTASNFKGRLALYKLVYAYEQNKLTPAEKKSVDDIVRVCISPAAIPRAMENYAKITIAQLKSCDPKNLDEVTTLLAEAFYQLTQIHPFGNANGRVATCLMNVFLRAFGYPSILLRHPGDKSNSSSDYAIAIAKLTVTREPLKALIKARIIAAQHTPYSDPFSKQYMHVRMQVLEIQHRLAKKHPKFNLNEYALSIIDEFTMPHTAMNNPAEHAKIHFQFLTFLIEKVHKVERSLEVRKPTMPSALSAIANPPTESELKTQLHALTTQEGWQISKSRKVAWFESKDNELIGKIAAALESSKIGVISSGKKTGSKDVYCVICKSIDYAQLSQSAKQTQSTLADAVKGLQLNS